MVEGEKWHARRKMLTPAFHFTILENFVEVFSEKSKILVKLLQKESGAEEFDIFPYINLCALDIICETAMGTDMKAQEQGEHSSYVKAVNNISHEVMQRILSPWLHPDFIFKLSPSARRSKKYLKVLHDFSNTGHDTTTMGISWTLQLLALHPEVQDKVFEELEDILQGSDRSPTIKELNEMKYLERVIKESLHGMSLPAGLRICALAVLTHRDPEHFPDPDIFDPDRFLPENIASRHPYAYIPFSAGPRNCIGQKFALLEEKMMISHVLLNFKLEATRSIPVGLPDIVLRPENGVHMKISPRRKT
ncbi:Cytochrome P450 4V2 [Blattella germanica]|nr:Cytochrome P450 4V2 [Blattella germanica]